MITSKAPFVALAYLLLLPLVLGQFGQFFQGGGGFPFGRNPFGGGGHHEHHQQHEQPGRSHKGWQEMQGVHCGAGYVCPASLACVPTPADCPCPYPEDIKCVIPDHRDRDEGEGPPFVCIRGGSCDEVERFAKPI
ncbi:long chronological lifespan protein 2 [Papiliotrema laurentii]|uniref:Long chronological lifespan protein 2 n=1 Tax=Papiliotrema laurentii TaxID=5418 RepID=A0AAD9FUJ9_PAPLA|nr:long chronological lifespan protein 2 [Papiliotrema laurentii]